MPSLPRPSAAALALLLLAAAAGVSPASAQHTAPPDSITTPAEGPAPDWFNADESEDRVRGISADKAYRTVLKTQQPKKTVTVAVIDSGVDIEHDDLDDRIWVNEDEIPENGEDDDRNGYVDDIHGWNFIGGRDGRNVDDDTYELTREYVRLGAKYEGVDGSTLSPEQREEYAYYQAVKDDFEAQRKELEEQLHLYQGANENVQAATEILREFLGTDTLTTEKLRGIVTIRNDVRNAAEYLLYLDQQGITPEILAEQMEQIEDQYEHGYNPEFDPRHIVGDDYDNPEDRFYGNNDVVGPDPSHGTAVAGVIAAERNNGIGIDGIAPDVRVMVIRAVPGGDERDKDVANAIRYAVDNGADIVNMSFGKDYSPRKTWVDEAVRYAEEKGVLLVHAAGNDGDDIDEAPNFPNQVYADGGIQAGNWLEVGASGRAGGDGFAATFSNYGRERVDVFAPGVDIYSTKPGQRFSASSGTSLAAPIVSGIAAMLEAYYPELTAQQLRDIILQSAVRYPGEKTTRPGDDRRVEFEKLSASGGVANAYTALQMAAQTQAQ